MTEILAFGLLAASGILVGVMAAIARRRLIRKTAVTAMFGIYSILLSLWLAAGIGHLFLQRATEDRLSRAELDALVSDIIAYGRIRSMDVDYLPSVNGTVVLRGNGAPDTPSDLRPEPLAIVLARDSIDPKRHAEFERRLAYLHFMAFWADSESVTLARDRGAGLRYQAPGSSLYVGERLDNVGRIVQSFAPHWYYAVW